MKLKEKAVYARNETFSEGNKSSFVHTTSNEIDLPSYEDIALNVSPKIRDVSSSESVSDTYVMRSEWSGDNSSRDLILSTMTREEINNKVIDFRNQKKNLITKGLEEDNRLTTKIKRRVKYIQWQIDTLEDALYGYQLDAMENEADNFLHLANEVKSFGERLDAYYYKTKKPK